MASVSEVRGCIDRTTYDVVLGYLVPPTEIEGVVVVMPGYDLAEVASLLTAEDPNPARDLRDSGVIEILGPDEARYRFPMHRPVDVFYAPPAYVIQARP